MTVTLLSWLVAKILRRPDCLLVISLSLNIAALTTAARVNIVLARMSDTVSVRDIVDFGET